MRKSVTYNGRRYYIRAKDETDYEVKKALKLKELEENKIIESNMLVKDWAREWMQMYKSGSCGDRTFKDYQIVYPAGNRTYPPEGRKAGTSSAGDAEYPQHEPEPH